MSSSSSVSMSSLSTVGGGAICRFSICQYFTQICEFCTLFFIIAWFIDRRNSIAISGISNSRSQYLSPSGAWSSSFESRSSGFRLSCCCIGSVRMRFGHDSVIWSVACTTPVFGLVNGWRQLRTVIHPSIRESSPVRPVLTFFAHIAGSQKTLPPISSISHAGVIATILVASCR
jgi:hypothetical protein